MQTDNPFYLVGYHGPEYFCDRERETKMLMEAIRAGRNVTLHSLRRMGKTGVLAHLIEKMGSRKYHFVYADIYATQSQQQFVTKFVQAVSIAHARAHKAKTALQSLLNLFTRLKPRIALDPATGLPSIEVEVKSDNEVEHGLDTAFKLLASEKRKTVVVILDEFQQIRSYDELRLEAMLRTFSQVHPGVRFIFSGSQRHLLMTMFGEHNEPFYRSTQLMALDPIDPVAYSNFIVSHFKKHKKKISSAVIEEILRWTKRHTYYTHYVCNRLFSLTNKNADLDLLNYTKIQILEENQYIYYQYRSLVTSGQWKLLSAIGQEEDLTQPLSSRFISKYNLGAASTVQNSLDALLKKHLIYQTPTDDAVYYSIDDVFLQHWLRKKYGS